MVKKLYRKGKRVRASNVKRTKNYCEECRLKLWELPKGIYLERHHKIPLSRGGKDEPSNIQVLCTFCHVAKHPEYRDFMIKQRKNRKSWSKW